MRLLGQTPSQTVGPYFAMCLVQPGQNVLRVPGTEGEPIRLIGRVLDAQRKIIDDALIELWQADARGHYVGVTVLDDDAACAPRFTGFGRSPTDHEGGEYWFDTIRPGRVVDASGAPQAPHLSVIVHARGMLLPSFTRVYFEDLSEDNARDPLLRSLRGSRRATLIAKKVGDEPAVFRFDIRVQGDDETVFLDV